MQAVKLGSIRVLVVSCVLAVAGALASPAVAAQGDCSQPLTNGNGPTASDCLFILRVAVGSATCDPYLPCVCAPKGTLPTTASDALVCLRRAVGQPQELNCQCGETTTSTSTSSTSSTSTTIPVIGGAEILIVNVNANNQGFNDPSPRSPVGGNDGTTLGEQRLIAFEHAAAIWESTLSSDVDIRVEASFVEQPCNSDGAVLGAAGARHNLRNFANAPRQNTWYPVALANKLAGTDLVPGSNDILAQFNSAIGTTCSFEQVWYYGLDADPPSGQIDLVSVVIHELAHGLGFATLVTLSSGAKGGGDGGDDTYMLNLEDHSTAEDYPEMSNAERVTASKDNGDLHWTGPAVVAAGTILSQGRHSPSGHVRMFAPSSQQPGSSVSHFDTFLSPNQIMEPQYTGANHDVGLARELMDDLGWNNLP